MGTFCEWFSTESVGKDLFLRRLFSKKTVTMELLRHQLPFCGKLGLKEHRHDIFPFSNDISPHRANERQGILFG